MKKFTAIAALTATTALVGGSVAIADAGTSTDVSLTSNVAPVNQPLTATAWEWFIDGYTVTDDNGNTQSWGGDHDGHTNVVEAYQYRIASGDTQADVQPAPESADLLTLDEQNAWYADLGYTDNDPYAFDWTVPMCRYGQDDPSTTVKPVLNSVQQWDVRSMPGFPDAITKTNFDDAMTLTGWGGSYDFFTDVDGYVTNDERTVTATDYASYTGDLIYNYSMAPVVSVYADFSCPEVDGEAGTLEMHQLLDADGNALTARTIDPSDARVMLNIGDAVTELDLDGFYVRVTGSNFIANAATWGIAKIGPAETAPTLASTGANAAPIVGIGAVVLLAGVGLLIWARRRKQP